MRGMYATSTRPRRLRQPPETVHPRELRMRPLDLAAPRAGLGAALLDELLEPLQIAAYAHRRGTERVADVLDEALGIPVELQHDLAAVVTQPVEGDHAGVLRSG